MAKPAYALNQIIYQLTTSWGGSAEGQYEFWPAKSYITYAIPDVAPASHAGEHAGFVGMTPFMKQQTRLAFELWDDLIDDNLVEIAAANGEITFALSTRTQGGGTYAQSSGTDYGNHATRFDSDIWLNANWASNAESGFVFGSYGFTTAIHEIGHALGLSHPGTYNAGSGGAITYAGNAEYSQDTRQYTLMSYFNEGSDGNGLSYGGRTAQTPLLHDVAAIQWLYGADMATRAGNTTYGFNSNAGRQVFDFNVNTRPIVCIWDGGGYDILDLSGSGYNQWIDLRPGYSSNVMGLNANLSIAYNAVIESGYGGHANDTVVGNGMANWLLGNGGDDRLWGLEGDDFFIGGAGVDEIWGGTGSDAFYFFGGPSGTNGTDHVYDFQVGTDRIFLDDALFGANYAVLPSLIKTQAQGWAWLDLPGGDSFVLWGVTEASIEQVLGSFNFF